MRLTLFSVQAFRPRQSDMVAGGYDHTPQRAIIEAMRTVNPVSWRSNVMWHMGVVGEVMTEWPSFSQLTEMVATYSYSGGLAYTDEQLEDQPQVGILFQIGREGPDLLPTWKGRTFEDEPVTRAPWTHALLQLPYEVLAIAYEPKLGEEAMVARVFQKMLQQSDYALSTGWTFEVTEIQDPTDFETALRQGSAVTKFEVSFRRPNAYNPYKHAIRPFKELAQEANARGGKAELQSEDLNRDVVARTARAAAAVGDEAAAWVRPEQGGRAEKKLLEGSPARVYVEDGALITRASVAEVFQRIKEVFLAIVLGKRR